VIDESSLALNFTNEVGFGGRVRFLKNIAGLWLLQECRRAWALDGMEYGYDELTHLAASAEPFQTVIPPDAFLRPGGMPAQIEAWCRANGQVPPDTPGAFARTIFESLALRYRQVFESLEAVTGRINIVHIVGGGSRNRLLNQFVSDATGRLVVAGPSEATAAGNVIGQAIGSGVLGSLEEGRAVVRRSLPLSLYEPMPSAGWDEAYARFLRLAGN
jgi:rhamnulokinase